MVLVGGRGGRCRRVGAAQPRQRPVAGRRPGRPGVRQALALSNALVNEETGVRGYVLTGRQDFLQPYQDGQQQEAQAVAALRQLQTGDLASAERVPGRRAAGRDPVARPSTPSRRSTQRQAARHRPRQDAVRPGPGRADAPSRRSWPRPARPAGPCSTKPPTTWSWSASSSPSRCWADRAAGRCWPTSAWSGRCRSWSREVRLVADGQFQRKVSGTGPREIVSLGADVDLDAAAHRRRAGHAPAVHDELTRSNARAGAVRLRRLARPAGAAAQGGQLLPAAAAPLRRPAGRAGRPVHRLRRRRRQADAGADQRPAGVLPGRPDRPGTGAVVDCDAVRGAGAAPTWPTRSRRPARAIEAGDAAVGAWPSRRC